MNFSGLIPKRVVIYYNLPRSHPAVAQSTELCVLIVNLSRLRRSLVKGRTRYPLFAFVV